MPPFSFHLKPTTITAAATPPISHVSVATFIVPAEATVTILGAVHLTVRADDCGSDEDEDDSSKTPPGHGGTPPGQAKKTCPTSSTAGSTSTTIPLPSSTQFPSTQPLSADLTSTSRGGVASRSAQESSYTTLTGGQSDADPSTMSTLTASSPSPTQHSSSAVTPASKPDVDLTVGSAIGIALGVFVATSIVVVVATFLFRFLWRRKRRNRDSANSESAERKLTSSEDTSSRRLSSTWTLSWFGSLAIGSDPDHSSELEQKSRRGAIQHLHDPDDPFYDEMGSEKRASMSTRGTLANPIERAYAPPPSRREDSDGTTHLPALAATGYSAYSLHFSSRRSSSAGA
ncbi:hypothetical protein GSI_08565 [Ganoderma sinense ZZ0214-1]|uniref:Uncharacterized protein n=1 Tax=Ganoderma sinense ZZ0214-1 TaxID=1077348 RepID=A0A2G8S470_9APHY|nr:hypothetical protein GSI_08565 [Ganoderma sinense ZZ0214-1]